MPPRCLGPCSSRRSAGGWMRVSRAPAVLLLLLLVSSALRDGAAADPGLQARCSRSCVAENCSTIGIRYGKFCGVGWTGCPGEKPCDELDACCKDHDECVEKKDCEGYSHCEIKENCNWYDFNRSGQGDLLSSLNMSLFEVYSDDSISTIPKQKKKFPDFDDFLEYLLSAVSVSQ